jgi:hypothetical protein
LDTNFKSAFETASGGKVDLTAALLNALLVNVSQKTSDCTVWAKHSVDEHCHILDALFWSMQSDPKRTFLTQTTKTYFSEDVLQIFPKLQDWQKPVLPKYPTPASLLQHIFCEWDRLQFDIQVVCDAVGDRAIHPRVLQVSLLMHVLDFPSLSDKSALSSLQQATATWVTENGTC